MRLGGGSVAMRLSHETVNCEMCSIVLFCFSFLIFNVFWLLCSQSQTQSSTIISLSISTLTLESAGTF